MKRYMLFIAVFISLVMALDVVPVSKVRRVRVTQSQQQELGKNIQNIESQQQAGDEISSEQEEMMAEVDSDQPTTLPPAPVVMQEPPQEAVDVAQATVSEQAQQAKAEAVHREVSEIKKEKLTEAPTRMTIETEKVPQDVATTEPTGQVLVEDEDVDLQEPAKPVVQEVYEVEPQITILTPKSKPAPVRVLKNEERKEKLEGQLPLALTQEELDGEKISDPNAFDLEAKRNQVMALIYKGIKFFNENESLDFILNNFCHNKDFRYAELYLFMYDMNGVCLATGRFKEQIWQNMRNARDKFSVLYVRQMIEKAKQGGGWIFYEWKNGIKVAYVTKVSKNGKDYVLSCGYFPFSKESSVISLVRSSVTIFNREVTKKGLAPEAIWGLISYKKGRLVYGDLHLYAVSFKGTYVAHGEDSGFIGSNAFDDKDDEGKFYHREMVEKLKENSGGMWFKNIINNAVKKTYAEKVTDKQGNEYFIACGYYPEIDKQAVVDLVRKAYVFVKGNGLREADEINKRSSEFLLGNLHLFAYDFKGNCVIDNENRTNVGENKLQEKDEDGVFYVKNIIEKAKVGGGWIDLKINNSFKSCYIESISLGTGNYAIGCGYYPSTKLETMSLLAKSAASYFRLSPTRYEALAEFTKDGGLFNRGDLQIFVLTLDGICLALGTERDFIWRKYFSLKDDTGVPLVKLIRDAIKNGPGLLRFKRKGVIFVVYAEEVEKDGQKYIICSGFNK